MFHFYCTVTYVDVRLSHPNKDYLLTYLGDRCSPCLTYTKIPPPLRPSAQSSLYTSYPGTIARLSGMFVCSQVSTNIAISI